MARATAICEVCGKKCHGKRCRLCVASHVTAETLRRREYQRVRHKSHYIKSLYKRGEHPNNHKPRLEESKRRTSETLRLRHKEKKWGWGVSPAWNKGLKGCCAGIPRHEYTDEWKKKAVAALHKYYETNDVWNKGKGKSAQEIRIQKRNYLRDYRQTENGKLNHRKYAWERRYKEKCVVHDFTNSEWLNKKKSTNGVCNRCNNYVGTKNLTLDHIIPLSKVQTGFIYTIHDVQALCKSCNSRKYSKIESEV